jgi:hypothetical protein
MLSGTVLFCTHGETGNMLRRAHVRTIMAGVKLRKHGSLLLEAADLLLEALFCLICYWSLCFGLFSCFFVCLLLVCFYN